MAKGSSWNKMFGKSSSSKNEASNKKSTKSNSESPKTATVVRNSMKADERWKSPTRGGKESKATPLATMEFLDCEINMASSSFVPFDKNQCSTEKEFIAKFTSRGHDLKIGRALIADKRSKLKNRGFFATTARNRAEVTYLLSLQTALEKEEKKQALKKSNDAKVAQMMKENNINGEVRPDAVMIQLGPDSTNATNTTTNTNNAKNENNKKAKKNKSSKKRKSQGLCGMGHIDETTIVFKKDFTCNEKNRVRTGLANLFFPELLKMKKEIKKFYPELKRELAIKRTILDKTAASASSSSQNPPPEDTDRPAPGFCTPRGEFDLDDKPTVLQCLRIKLLIGQAEEDVIGKNGNVLLETFDSNVGKHASNVRAVSTLVGPLAGGTNKKSCFQSICDFLLCRNSASPNTMTGKLKAKGYAADEIRKIIFAQNVQQLITDINGFCIGLSRLQEMKGRYPSLMDSLTEVGRLLKIEAGEIEVPTIPETPIVPKVVKKAAEKCSIM